MQSDFETVCDQVTDAYHPEDLFGVEDVILPTETMLEFLKKGYLTLKATLEPGLDDLELRDMAEEACTKLERLYENAQTKVRRFHYGMLGFNQSPPRIQKGFSIGANRYLIGPVMSSTDAAQRFQGHLERDGEYLGRVDIVLAKTADDNDSRMREARAIDALHATPVPQWKHLPYLLDRFETDNRMGLIFRTTYGLTLTEVRTKRAQRAGVDQRHIAWMLDRTLSALGFVHRCGLVHGSLSPDSIVVNDRLHNATLTEWGCSALNPARTGDRVVVDSQLKSPFCAPEVIAAGEIGPWSDIYALGKTMIWLIGGDPVSNSIPTQVEPEFANFLLRMVHEDHYQRSTDCWELYEEQCRIKDALWPRKFLHFDVS